MVALIVLPFHSVKNPELIRKILKAGKKHSITAGIHSVSSNPKDAIKYRVLSFDWNPAKGLAMKNDDAKFENNLKQNHVYETSKWRTPIDLIAKPDLEMYRLPFLAIL